MDAKTLRKFTSDGVPLKVLLDDINAHTGNTPEECINALVTTLNGINALRIAIVQPVMPDAEAVWDGKYHVTADGLGIVYIGYSGPNSLMPKKRLLLGHETLIVMFPRLPKPFTYVFD